MRRLSSSAHACPSRIAHLSRPGAEQGSFCAKTCGLIGRKNRPGRRLRRRQSSARSGIEAERAFIERIDQRIAKGDDRALVLHGNGCRVFFGEVWVMMGSWSHCLGCVRGFLLCRRSPHPGISGSAACYTTMSLRRSNGR